MPIPLPKTTSTDRKMGADSMRVGPARSPAVLTGKELREVLNSGGVGRVYVVSDSASGI